MECLSSVALCLSTMHGNEISALSPLYLSLEGPLQTILCSKSTAWTAGWFTVSLPAFLRCVPIRLAVRRSNLNALPSCLDVIGGCQSCFKLVSTLYATNGNPTQQTQQRSQRFFEAKAAHAFEETQAASPYRPKALLTAAMRPEAMITHQHHSARLPWLPSQQQCLLHPQSLSSLL